MVDDMLEIQATDVVLAGRFEDSYVPNIVSRNSRD